MEKNTQDKCPWEDVGGVNSWTTSLVQSAHKYVRWSSTIVRVDKRFDSEPLLVVSLAPSFSHGKLEPCTFPLSSSSTTRLYFPVAGTGNTKATVSSNCVAEMNEKQTSVRT